MDLDENEDGDMANAQDNIVDNVNRDVGDDMNLKIMTI